MRYTLQSWRCGSCHTRNDGEIATCSGCDSLRRERHARVHATERASVFWNPVTGEHKTPARSDAPVPEVYARQGFERREIDHMGTYERETGSIHEDSNYNSGNAEAEILRDPPMPQKDPKMIDALVDHLRS